MGLINKSYLVTFNQRVQGSSPCAPTIRFCSAFLSFALEHRELSREFLFAFRAS